MFDSSTFTIEMLSNPTKLAKTVIDQLEKTDTGNSIQINDPNNGFVMQLMAGVAIFSKFSEKVDYTSNFYYPQRSRNASQLYPHLSEFDYIKLMASPATLPFLFAMSRDWIIKNGVYYDTNYDKIEIPETSFITMGGVVYSMYHPIEILINRNTSAVTAFYKTGSSNKLNTLSTNQLKDVQEFTKDGINYFQIVFDMYQFERKTIPYTVASEQGFLQKIGFEDQFYAVEIFTQQADGTWKELAYSLSQLYYDFQNPTAILSLLTDTSQLKIEIPQIYFDNQQISKNIRVQLYTTKGSVNYALSPADITSLSANFDTKSSDYAAPLAQMPTWTIVPTVSEVSGGSDVMSYEEIREAVVNQRLYDRVAVTTPEIIEAGKRAGFNLSRITDDLTERVYYASNILADSNDMVVPTFAGNILIANEALAGNPSTILDYSDGYYTILPTTTFKISKTGLTCVPMTDGQVAAMSQMTNAQMVDELNTGMYVRQPFHITLVTAAKSPQSLVYNLLSPSMTSLVFVAENPHSAPQMSVIACNVTHLNNGTGGYQILLDVQRSSNIEKANIANFKITLTCLTKTGDFAYLPATYVATKTNGVDVWQIQVSTSYHLTSDDFLTVQMYSDQDVDKAFDISLNQTFTVLSSFVTSFDSSVPIDAGLNTLLPKSLKVGNTVMAQQTLSVSLGHNLSAQIYCGVNTSWGNDVYKTADSTVYLATNVPIFQYTESGALNHRSPNNSTVEVVKLYEMNDVPAATQDIVVKTTTTTFVPGSGSTTTVFKVEDATGILVGMPARGTNIPVGAKVQSVSGLFVTLDKVLTIAIPVGGVLTFTNAKLNIRTTAVQSSPGTTLTVASTSGIYPGQSVMGFDIPPGAKVLSVNSPTQFTITIPTSVAVATNTLLTIINKTAHGIIKTAKGDVVRDPSGLPIVIKEAQNQYRIPAILFDGRLFASADPNDRQLVTSVSQRLQNYANQISTIDAGLIEDSHVYYKPARTMGLATFGIGGGQVITMSLELSFSFTVYVDVSVYNTQTLLSTMSRSIVSVVNKAIQKNIISVSAMTDTIVETLGTNVAAVEGGDISGIDGLRLISLQDSGATPSIENKLSIQSDGSITRSPNIEIKYRPKPDTTEVTNFAA